MFNEGVDLPDVDTILMLRPTESRILWLQQFGRGLRFRPAKRLEVIDYIGNHRVFLTKTRALLNLGDSDREVAFALDSLDAGTMELPPGCSVTYELEAKDIIRSLLRMAPQGDQLRTYYEEFRDLHGARPLASEVYQDGYDPRASRRGGYGSWFDFVQAMGDLSPRQVRIKDRLRVFLEQLETKPMSRSYPILLLLAMLIDDTFPEPMEISGIVHRFGQLARRYAGIRTEIGEALENRDALRILVESQPIAAWTRATSATDVPYFRYDNGMLSPTLGVSVDDRYDLQEMVREVAEWRLAAYLSRPATLRGAELREDRSQRDRPAGYD
jgi:hypothetical protein